MRYLSTVSTWKMFDSVILIGPVGAGKSSVGEQVSKNLALPSCSIDDVRENYYKEIGYDEDEAAARYEAEGFWGRYKYWKPFEAYAVERILSENVGSVIDFGAGHSVYEDESLFLKVKSVLAPYPFVFLLLPSPDLEKSLDILNKRVSGVADITPNPNRHFLAHPSNAELANFTIYTENKTVEQVAKEVSALVTAGIAERS